MEGFHAHPDLLARAVAATVSGDDPALSPTQAGMAVVPFLLVARDAATHWELYQQWRHHQAMRSTAQPADSGRGHFEQLRAIQDLLLHEAGAATGSGPTVLDVDGLDFDALIERMHVVALERMQHLLHLRSDPTSDAS